MHKKIKIRNTSQLIFTLLTCYLNSLNSWLCWNPQQIIYPSKKLTITQEKQFILKCSYEIWLEILPKSLLEEQQNMRFDIFRVEKNSCPHIHSSQLFLEDYLNAVSIDEMFQIYFFDTSWSWEYRLLYINKTSKNVCDISRFHIFTLKIQVHILLMEVWYN